MNSACLAYGSGGTDAKVFQSICSGALTSCAFWWKCKASCSTSSGGNHKLCNVISLSVFAFILKIKAWWRPFHSSSTCQTLWTPQVTPAKSCNKSPCGNGLGDIWKFLRNVPKGSTYGLLDLKLWNSFYQFLKGHVQNQRWFTRRLLDGTKSLSAFN